MPTDGEIGCTTYTPAQLSEALARIDATQFPINYGRMKQAIDQLLVEPAPTTALPERLVLCSWLGMAVSRLMPAVMLGIGFGGALWLWFWPQQCCRPLR